MASGEGESRGPEVFDPVPEVFEMPPGRRDARLGQLLSVVRDDTATTGSGLRPSRFVGRPVTVAVAVVVLLVAASGAVLLPHFTSRQIAPLARAVTPPLLHYQLAAGRSGDARATLEQLARAADAQPTEPGKPAISYLASRSWYLDTRVDGAAVTSRIVPATQEVWVRPDGSGVIERRWDDGHSDQVVLAGIEQYDVRRLPADPRALERLMAANNTLEQGPAGYLEAVKDIWLTEAPAPAVQAALLRLLAMQPGIHLRGQVTDRLGRQGVAVSADLTQGLPRRYSLILDPTTGDLWGYEEELTTDPGKLNVPVPSVIGYQAWTRHTWVNQIGRTAPPDTSAKG